MRVLANYSLLARLPSLRPQFCNEPPIKLDNFWQRIKETNPKIAPLIQATLLSREIANLEQFYVGKSPLTSAVTPLEILAKAVKSPNILQDYWPVEMMSCLMPDSLPKNIWKLYLSYALKLAREYQSCLQNWLQWDWLLRYHLFLSRTPESVKATSQWLGELISLEVTPNHQQILAMYQREQNPQQAELLIDRARWQKLSELVYSYSFDSDELVVYALQLMLLERWWNLSQSQEDLFAKVLNG